MVRLIRISGGQVVSEWSNANVMGRLKTFVLVVPHELMLVRFRQLQMEIHNDDNKRNSKGSC